MVRHAVGIEKESFDQSDARISSKNLGGCEKLGPRTLFFFQQCRKARFCLRLVTGFSIHVSDCIRIANSYAVGLEGSKISIFDGLCLLDTFPIVSRTEFVFFCALSGGA